MELTLALISPTPKEGSFESVLLEFNKLDREIDRLENELWDEFLNDHTGSVPSPQNDLSLSIMRARAIKLLTKLGYHGYYDYTKETYN